LKTIAENVTRHGKDPVIFQRRYEGYCGPKVKDKTRRKS
jgi:hypothetical protein